MSNALILTMLLAFAIGTAAAWIQARRRMKAQLRDRLVAEAENRIKQELIRRLAQQADASVHATDKPPAGKPD